MTENIDYRAIFRETADELEGGDDRGRVADYIPELGNVDPRKLGVHLTTVGGEHHAFGDSLEKFSIQSISKVLSLALALKVAGEGVWERVGVEPSGTAFNSLVQLEHEHGIPRNPLINAGAIVVCDVLLGCLDDPKRELLEFVRGASGLSGIDYSSRMAASEMACGHRNFAVAHLMKDLGNIRGDVPTVLDLYFHSCSIEMSCRELAQTFLFLAADGVGPTGEGQVVSSRQAKRINSIMLMCGFYDESGEFAYSTGLPGKSGVGGGIVAVHPGKYSIAVWSPPLNENGNSYKGMKVLEAVTTRTRSSIF